MPKMLITLCLLLPLLGQAGSSRISADPAYAKALLKSFNGFCPTVGSWTTNALAEAQKIRGIIESLRHDPSCTEAAQAVISHTNSLERALYRANSINSTKKEISSIRKQQVDILQLLEGEENESFPGFIEVGLSLQSTQSLQAQRGPGS